MRQPFDRGKFEAVVRIVVELWDVCDDKIKGSKLCRIRRLEAIERHRLVCDRVDNRLAAQGGDGHIVRGLNCCVFDTDQILLGPVVIGDTDPQVTQDLFFVTRAKLRRVRTAHLGVDVRTRSTKGIYRYGVRSIRKPFVYLRNPIPICVGPSIVLARKSNGVSGFGQARALHNVIDSVIEAQNGIAFPGGVQGHA